MTSRSDGERHGHPDLPAGRPRAAAGVSSLLGRTDAAFLLALWVLSAAVRWLASLPLRQPLIFMDELQYWQMARSFHSQGTFLLFGRFFDLPSVLYPVVLSPIFAIADPEVGFRFAQSVNALLVTMVVFPAYWLARELLDRPLARAVAVLSAVAVGGVYSALVMAENVYYPLFCLAFWLALRTLLRGHLSDGVLAAVAIFLAYFAKPHLLALASAYGISALAWLLANLRGRERLEPAVRGFLARLVPLGGLLAALPARMFLSGRGPGGNLQETFFGSVYASLLGEAAERSDPAHAIAFAGWQILALGFATGFVPLASFFVALVDLRKMSSRWRWFLFLVGTTIGIYVLLVSRYTLFHHHPSRIQERYLFVLAPMLAICLFALTSDARRRRVGAACLLAGGFALLVATRPAAILEWANLSDAPSLALLFASWRASHGPWLAVGATTLIAAITIVGSLRATEKPLRAVAAVASVLATLNLAWYLDVRRVNGDFRYKDTSLRLRSRMAKTDRLTIVEDSLPPHLVWSLQFWLDRPIAMYCVSEPPNWYTDAFGPADHIVDSTRPTYVVASSKFRGTFGDGASPVLVASTLPVPVSVYQIRPTIAVRYRNMRIPTVMDAGGVTAISFLAENAGQMSWSCCATLRIRFGYHWANPSRTGNWDSIVWDDGGRGALPRDVSPGDVVPIRMAVRAPAKPGLGYKLVIVPLLEGPSGGWTTNSPHVVSVELK